MSKITDAEVAHLANLARLGLDETERAQLTSQLDAIVGFVEQLQGVDTTKVEITSQVTGLEDVWRDDAVVPCQIGQAELFQNAPQTKDGYLKVNRVL